MRFGRWRLGVVQFAMTFVVGACQREASPVSPTALRTAAANTSPVAVLDDTAYYGWEGFFTKIDASGSHDADGDPLTFIWMKPGQPNNPGTFANYRVWDQGSYPVELIVRDPSGAADTAVATYYVTNFPPYFQQQAFIDSVVKSGSVADLFLNFSDPGKDDFPWTYLLTWPDGVADTLIVGDRVGGTFKHRLYRPGHYDVMATITDKDGGSDTTFVALSVIAGSLGVDVKPNSGANIISLSAPNDSTISIAILGTDSVDVSTLHRDRISVGNLTAPDATPIAGSLSTSDVNSDGHLDRAFKVRRADLVANGDLKASTKNLHVRAHLMDGRFLRGNDAVSVNP